MHLHRMSVHECVELINREDRQVAEAVDRARPALVAFIEAIAPGFLAGGRLIYLGAGTSGRLGVLDASEAPPTFDIDPSRIVGLIAGGDAALRRSSEGREDDPIGAAQALAQLQLTGRDALLGIAAGGTTPYVLGGLQLAKSLPQPPTTGLLVCTHVPAAEATGIDHLLIVETGPEILTGSTRMKAGTATKMVLNIISTTLMVQSGRIYQNLMVDLRATNDKLKDRAARIISTLIGTTRSESLRLLHEAGGDTRIAILMGRCGICRMEAQRRLADAGSAARGLTALLD
jgi:N-acetylmuramic acid 6-phosphate etherase